MPAPASRWRKISSPSGAQTHNPQLPEPLRKKFGLPEDARIPVTPMMMEKNIESLARMMALFREAGLAPQDYEKVVAAFDLAYSNAETYRTSHIEKVFGPMDKMDEPLFFLILSRMNSNLAERWRKMDVQNAGLTRRDETQTLELVRAGYATALQLIEGWLAGHGDSSRALTLAGTLLTDWGDFEYFQELVTSDPKKRMAGYKEKNLQAQDYFNRGAEAYAKEGAQARPGRLLDRRLSRLVQRPARHRLQRPAQSLQGDEPRRAESIRGHLRRCRPRPPRRTSASSPRS